MAGSDERPDPQAQESAATGRPPARLAAFVAELRRRRVFRALVGWGIFSFAVLQVAEPLIHGLGLPEWTLKVAIAALGLGFPATVLLAWAYDVTSHGIRRTAEAGSAVAGEARRHAAPLVGLVALGAILGGLVSWLALRHAGPPTAPPDASGRILVAVADMVNQTGEQELDVLSGLLVTSLEQSRRLSVMTQARVLDLAIRAGRKDASRVDETLGREVGKANGVRTLLLPAIRRLGTTYSLEMRAVDPGRDEHLFTLSDRATSKEALLDMLDRLSERTRTELGEGRGDVAKTRVLLGESVTRSLEAYQHYVTGLDAWNRDGHRTAGLDEFQQALGLDPGFAAAHSELAFLLHAYGRPDLASPHWQAADENLARMPEKERTLLQLRRAFATPSTEGWSRDDGLRLATDLVARFPKDKHVLVDAAHAYDVLGARDRRDAILRAALELDPGFYAAARELSARLGDRAEEALEVARRAVATRRSPANLSVLAEALHASGGGEEAMATAREALRADGSSSSLVAERACFVLYQGGADVECLPVWERIQARGANVHERDLASFQLVQTLVGRGRVREGMRAMRSLDEARRGQPMRLSFLLVTGRFRLDAPEAREQARRIPYPQWRRNWLSWLGAAEEAARVDATLRDHGAIGAALERAYRATRAASEGRFAEAAEQMQLQLDDLRSENRFGWQFSQASFLAEMLLADGRPEEAARVWPATLPCRCRDPVDYGANYPSLAIFRARAMEKLGRRADAVRELDGLLAFWKEADDDLPLLVEAKGMRTRLARTLAARTAAAGAGAAPSIAVLPFADMSQGRDQEYFADGVAEEILNALTHVRGIKVVGRTSSFSFKGKKDDLRTIGRRLGVGAILEGSVRKDGGRVRVSAQLVKASDGFQLWSDSYDRELTGVFRVQDEIARAVVAKLTPVLGARPETAPPAAQATRPEAYDQYLVGRQLVARYSTESQRRAEEAFARAVALDSSYAPAWVGLARALTGHSYLADDVDQRSLLDRALAAAERAVALAPGLAAGYAERAILRQATWDWKGAIADAERALGIDPGSADVHYLLAVIAKETTGDWARAIEHHRKAAELDPLSSLTWSRLGHAHAYLGETALARTALGRALELDPQNENALWGIAKTEFFAGNPEQARAWWRKSASESTQIFAEVVVEHALGRDAPSRQALAELVRKHGSRYPCWVAEAHAQRGEAGEAFAWLDRARERRDAELRWLRGNVWFRALHGDPRWKALLRAMNLPVE